MSSLYITSQTDESNENAQKAHKKFHQGTYKYANNGKPIKQQTDKVWQAS